ncbi:Uncharacterised protein [Mycobacterium tuberculosis]|uniref:Uncharacterized protein n=1 Tax=Mycobacterium tuberculosis TaxID=1773 RepID=A0A916LCR2_MYCTX|nr:Uncharacterised protein [Mycobacterium tuberculosis]
MSPSPRSSSAAAKSSNGAIDWATSSMPAQGSSRIFTSSGTVVMV